MIDTGRKLQECDRDLSDDTVIVTFQLSSQADDLCFNTSNCYVTQQKAGSNFEAIYLNE